MKNPAEQPLADHSGNQAGNDSTPSTNRPKRPLWPWLLSVLMIAGGLLVWSLDELPSDVSDLKVQRLNLPDEDNAYVLLTRVGEDAIKALNLSDEDKKSFGYMSAGEEWDDSKVDAWLSAVDPLWLRYEKAAHTMTSEVSAADLLTRKFSVIRPLNKLVELSQMRAHRALRNGKPDEALTHALLAIQAGKRLEQSRGGVLELVVSTGIKFLTLDLIETIIRDPHVSSEALRALIPTLGDPDNKEALNDAIRTMFGEGEFWLTKFEQEGYESILDSSEVWVRLGPYASSVPVLYKRNKTLRLYAQQLRAMREVVGANATQIEHFKKTHKYAYVGEGRSALNPDNLIGRKILDEMNPVSLLLPTFRLRYGSKAGAVQALAAALLYQREAGTVPPSLEALVPKYLSAVPIDFYDDAPLRYSAEFGAIWSTGSDGLIVGSRDQHIKSTEIVTWIVPPPARPATSSADPGVK